jgi:hypothetical protein
MYGRYPVIYTPVIRNHYMRLEIFKPDSPPAPEDLAPVVSPAAIEVPSLGQKVGRVLREEGVVELVREVYRYLRWRLVVSR